MAAKRKEKIELDEKTAMVFERKDYEVLELLSQGSFGKVYKCTYTDPETKNKSIRAVKVLDTTRIDEKFVKDFLTRELEMLQKIKHPNVLQVFDIILANKRYYIFMQFAGGGSLDRRCVPSPPPRKLARKWFVQVTEALAYMHDELFVCHRDIKLENILLDCDGNAKLSDFGFTRHHYGGLATTLCGTTPYYSPDLIQAKSRGYDPFKADVWAMGVTLFAMSTSKLPFNQFPKKSHPPPAEWKAFLQQHMTRWYRTRPQWDDLEDDLKDLIDRLLEPTEEKRLTAVKTLKHPWCKKK